MANAHLLHVFTLLYLVIVIHSSWREFFGDGSRQLFSMSMSMPAMPTVSDAPSDSPSDVPSQSPSVSTATAAPTTAATLPLAGSPTPAPTLGVVTTTTSGPTSTQETFDVKNKDGNGDGNITAVGSGGLDTLTISMICVVAVAVVAVIAAVIARKKLKSPDAAAKGSALGVATASEGGASISDISTDAPPSANAPTEI